MPDDALRLALWPAEVAYGCAVWVRAVLYRRGIFRRRRLDGTVISVGNLTVGGTGKTPMVLWLAERLAEEGRRPAILTRGYRGVGRAGEPDMNTADEAALLRERLGSRAQIAVGKERYASGRRLEQQGVRWFVLDDGFQHLALQRDADIVLVDATEPFGGGHLLPVGRLREPRSALSRADVVVITRAENAPAVETIVHRYTPAPVFYAHTAFDSVVPVSAPALAAPELDVIRTKVFAFCGIGNSGAFFDDLRRWGFLVTGQRSFRDHHRYSVSDMAHLERAATESKAEAMICTEKDLFNLRGVAAARLPIYACRIRLQLSDSEGFWNAVCDAMHGHRPETRT
jgi:tetraacyldisaccharide 4'-kinase